MPTARLRKSGDSLVITIPPSYAAQNRLTAGSRISVQIDGDELVVTPVHQRKTLAQLLAATPAANRVDGWD